MNFIQDTSTIFLQNFIPVVWRSRHSVQGERLVLQRAQAGLLHPTLSHHLPPDQVTPAMYIYSYRSVCAAPPHPGGWRRRRLE